MSYVRTHTGRSVSLVDPDPQTIDIRDIACSLSRINRFSGATRLPINVADHSLNVVRLLSLRRAPASIQMLGLLHDAHETYIGDITTPVRAELAAACGDDIVWRMCQRLDQAILASAGLSSGTRIPLRTLAFVSAADAAVFAAEWRDFMQGPCPSLVDPAPFAIKPRNADRSEEDFLWVFHRLRVEMGPVPEIPDMAF